MRSVFLKKREKMDLDAFSQELQDFVRSSPESPKTTFEARNSQVTPKNLSDLCAVIRTTTTLKTLFLVGCRLNNSTQLKDLFEALKSNNSVTRIDMSDNMFGDDGAELIAEMAQIKHNITEVSMSNCGITTDGCAFLKKMLELNKNIALLDFSSNPQIGDDGVKLLCQGILDCPLGERSTLRKLCLSNVQVGDDGCKIIGSVVASTASLRSLDLHDNEIGRNGAKFLSYGLMKKHIAGDLSDKGGLEELDLSKNKIGNEGVNHLAKRLPASGVIRSLRLNDVGMGTESFKRLCTAVVESDCIVDLAVGSNPVDANSLANVAIDMLNNSSTLACLDLSNIALSKEDVKVLGEFLGDRLGCRLRELDLSATNICNEGASYIAKGLKTNMDLKVLDVTSNPFGPKGAKAFAKVFRRAKQLELFKVTGQSRIKAEGENYLAEVLRWNKKIEIKGASRELDYMADFLKHGKAFTYNTAGEMTGWSEEAWEAVKRGCGQIIATLIHLMDKKKFAMFEENVLRKSKNVVNQDMFEYVLRHAEAPALEVVNVFVNKCKIPLDSVCSSKASVAMAKEFRKSDDVTYRFVAKEQAKDPMVKEMAKNNRLFLGRYLTENGPAVHETHEVIRFLAKDTAAVGNDKNKKIFVQIYESDSDFERERRSREELKEKLRAAGPFAIYDTILKDVEIHDDNNVVSYLSNITDLRHCINNLGVTSGYDLHETIFLAKRAAQCLGTINNLGRIHGDFRPRNFLKVAPKRKGTDPVGRTNKTVQLPDKWVVFDLSKSVSHGDPVELRMDSSYIPPEVARVTFNSGYSDKQLPIASEKMDVWSFGVVLFQLLTGTHLFHCETNTDRLYKSKERLELMNWINLDAKRQNMVLHKAAESIFHNETSFKRIKAAAIDLVNWCLQGDPHNRPSFNDILSHPFFVYRTNVNYTDLDLLLGWYKKIGADISSADHKNNRTHAHVINAVSKQSADVFTVMKLLYGKVGCSITNDADDWKLDVSQRRENVQKSRTLVTLLEKGVFWRTEVIQKIIWAMDSLETNELILLDISTAFTNAEKFDFDAYLAELETPEGSKNLDALVKSLLPVEEKLNLNNLHFEKNPSKQGAWLKSFILDEVNEYIMSLKDKVIPYRTRAFQTEAMINEMLKRSSFISTEMLRKFDLFNNNKSLYDQANEDEEEETKNEIGTVKILVLFNEETMQVSADKIRDDAQALRRQLMLLENSKVKPEIALISSPHDVFQHFTMSTERSVAADGKVASSRLLTADEQTLVLCLVSQGFYDVFREQMQLLDAAKGVVTVLPISYDYFDLSKSIGKEEVLNLGIENKDLLERLQDNRCYIPLPKSEKQLKYETDAALNYIMKESEKLIDLAKENQDKNENEVYTKYSKSNFFQKIY